jgi:hypothetical protein
LILILWLSSRRSSTPLPTGRAKREAHLDHQREPSVCWRARRRAIAPAKLAGTTRPRCANTMTRRNRPVLESGRSMTLRWLRRGKYIV